MSEGTPPHSNLQKFALLITAPSGSQWVVGTETQRGFTDAGCDHAYGRALEIVPKGWTVQQIELTPISELAVVR